MINNGIMRVYEKVWERSVWTSWRGVGVVGGEALGREFSTGKARAKDTPIAPESGER